MKANVLFSLCAIVGFALQDTARGQELFRSEFSDREGFVLALDDDTEAEFGWDYSQLGIPPAPNSEDGDTIGLRLASNVTDDGPGAAAISVSPDEEFFSGQFEVQFDFWLNYSTSGGTTEYAGGAVGFDARSGAIFDGAALMVNTDGDAASDYVLFNEGVELGLDSGQYAIPSLDHAAPENENLRTAFPGNPPPASQETEFAQALVANPDGTFGFGWHTMTIRADSGAGTATFLIDGFEFGTVTGEVAGSVALTHWDRFNSVADKPDLAFGVYDNLIVTQIPEPATGLLLLLSCCCLLGGRRRA
jgi:hypothetical protein